jgi:hypothetical protein
MDRKARRRRLVGLAQAAGYMEPSQQPLPFGFEWCAAHGKPLEAHSHQEAAHDERASDGP